MKEDGRSEDYQGNTAWGNPMRPHLSTKLVRQEDCYEDSSSLTAGENLMPSTDSQPKENKCQSSSRSSWRSTVREDSASSTHSTERPWVRLTPAPKPQGDPLIDFQSPSDEGKDTKDHIIQNMDATFGRERE